MNDDVDLYYGPEFAVKYWYDLADGLFDDANTPPSIFIRPEESRRVLFGVQQKPYDGNVYIGLVTRDDGSYETMGTQLKRELTKGKKYEFYFYNTI